MTDSAAQTTTPRINPSVYRVTWADVQGRVSELATIVQRLPGFHAGDVPGLVALPGAAVPTAWLAGTLGLDVFPEPVAGCVLVGLTAGPEAGLRAAQDALDAHGRNVAAVLYLYRHAGAPYVLTTDHGVDYGDDGEHLGLGPAAYPLEAAEAVPGADPVLTFPWWSL